MEAKLSIGPSLGLLMDAADFFIFLEFGAIAAICSFIIAVLLEAWLSGKFFGLRSRQRLLYSFIANLTSAACGIVCIIYRLIPLENQLIGIIISLLLTFPIEYLCWIIFLKARGRALLKALYFCIAANVASYVVFILLIRLVIFLLQIYG